MFILMLGSCSSKQELPSGIDECPAPEIEIKEVLVTLDAKLTEQHKPPIVPSSGDNANLLEWAVSCKGALKMVNDQLESIQKLER